MTRRESYIQYCEQYLKPIKAYRTVGVPYGPIMSMHGDAISWLEMFARSMYGVVAYTAAVGNNEYVRIFNDAIHTIVIDPRYKNFEEYDQKNVELVPIVLMLYIHRVHTWDTYTNEQKHNLVQWLNCITQSKLFENNWQFFRILVCEMLSRLTGSVSYSSYIQASWDIVEQCYTGRGWYRDGINGPKDYYIAWGYHFYSLLHTYLFPELKERNDVIHERARDFAKDYLYLFDNQGRMIPFGRSLIYRFAALSFWSMYVLTGHTDIDTTLVFSLIDKSLKWWHCQNIITSNGLVNLGFAYQNEGLCENYNSSGSSYWFLKFFLILLLDRDNSIWNLPYDEVGEYHPSKGIYEIANGDIIVAVNDNWNIAYVNSYYGCPHPQNAAKYMRFAYNSASGFNLSKDSTNFYNLSDDSSLVIDIAGVKHQREHNRSYSVKDGILEYKWNVGKLLSIQTFVVPLQNSYYRIHLIASHINCVAYETGTAIQSNHLQIQKSNDKISLSNNQYVSYMACLLGYGVMRMVQNEVNSNIYYHYTCMPAIQYRIWKGYNLIMDQTSFENVAAERQSAIPDIPIRLSFSSVTLAYNDVCHRVHLGARYVVSLWLNKFQLGMLQLWKLHLKPLQRYFKQR